MTKNFAYIYIGKKVIYQQPALERCDNLGRVEEEVLAPPGSMSALEEVA
jgi:hypothetical protein